MSEQEAIKLLQSKGYTILRYTSAHDLGVDQQLWAKNGTTWRQQVLALRDSDVWTYVEVPSGGQSSE